MSSSKSKKSDSTPILLLVIGGILLIIAGATGNIGWIERLVGFLTLYLGPSETALVEVILTVLNWVANLGGISVLIGAYFVHKGRTRTGKFLVSIGAGVGIFNLLLLLIPSFLGGSLLVTYFLILSIASTTYGLGILLTIAGRLKV